MTSVHRILVVIYVIGRSACLAGRDGALALGRLTRRMSRRRERGGDDRGEGIISTAIAVLVMAFLGAAMWVGFKAIWDSTEDTVNDKVTEIGR